MDHVVLNDMHLSAVPLLHGVGIQLFEVLMISVDKQCRHRQTSENGSRIRFVCCRKAADADISADDQIVIPGVLVFVLVKIAYNFSNIKGAMGIACNDNAHSQRLLSCSLFLFSKVSQNIIRKFCPLSLPLLSLLAETQTTPHYSRK